MNRKNLRINAPVCLKEEVGPLIEEGADEFYCGFLPSDWHGRFSRVVSINRRNYAPGNVQSFNDLHCMVREAHAGNVPVHLTLNAQTYTCEQLDFLRDYCRKVVEEAGIDGFVVADPGLISLIKEWIPEISIHVSNLAALHNSMAVRFFSQLGAKRIILPRQVSVKEVAEMQKMNPEIEFEAFILNDGCVLEEGNCCTTHDRGAFCMTEWHYQFRTNGKRNSFSAKEEEDLKANQEAYSYWIRCHEDIGRFPTPTGYSMGPCGLCAIPALYQAGVNALKVVGRESSMDRKIKSVRITRIIRDMVMKDVAGDEIINTALDLRETHDACKSGYFCYYPSIIRKRAKEDLVNCHLS